MVKNYGHSLNPRCLHRFTTFKRTLSRDSQNHTELHSLCFSRAQITQFSHELAVVKRKNLYSRRPLPIPMSSIEPINRALEKSAFGSSNVQHRRIHLIILSSQRSFQEKNLLTNHFRELQQYITRRQREETGFHDKY